MHYNILDKKRVEILPFLKAFKEDFYLAGGTGLALQIGHRDSVDFDFFSADDFDTQKLYEKIRSVFSGFDILKTQEEKNTLTVFINKDIKLSFFTYKYPLLEPLAEDEFIKAASIFDIACMKFSAITGRASNKDYIDLYFILQDHSLKILLEKCSIKMPGLDPILILKSLVYFDDLEEENIKFMPGREVKFEKVKCYLAESVRII
jgi:hypothetical protein